jgi:hypothetical protein
VITVDHRAGDTVAGAAAGFGPVLGDRARPHAASADDSLGQRYLTLAAGLVDAQGAGADPGQLGHAEQLVRSELRSGQVHHATGQVPAAAVPGRPAGEVITPAT